MSIIVDDTFLRLDTVNNQVCLPHGVQLVYIEVPKVLDKCIISRCLIFDEGRDTNGTDRELRSNPLINPKQFLGCGHFHLTPISIEKLPLCQTPDYKKVVICFVIWFHAYYKDSNGKKRKELFEINRTETIPRLYCPDKIVENKNDCPLPRFNSQCAEDETIKIEMAASCIEGSFAMDSHRFPVLDITMEYELMVKSQHISQLLVPTYDYGAICRQCEEEPCASRDELLEVCCHDEQQEEPYKEDERSFLPKRKPQASFKSYIQDVLPITYRRNQHIL